jgi:IS30 family transposase
MEDYNHLESEERARLAELRAQGFGIRAAARELGRDPSTISRELRRNALLRDSDELGHRIRRNLGSHFEANWAVNSTKLGSRCRWR